MDLTIKRSIAAQELSFTLTLTTTDLMRRVQQGELDPFTVVEALRTLEAAFTPGVNAFQRLEAVREFLDVVLPTWVSLPERTDA